VVGESRWVEVTVRNTGKTSVRDAAVLLTSTSHYALELWAQPRGGSAEPTGEGLRFQLPPMTPGRSVTSRVLVRAVETGSATIMAALESSDDQSSNDSSSQTVSVTRPSGRELAGRWSGTGITRGRRGGRFVQGSLRVENLGLEDAGESRLVFFLSEDTVPDHQDYLLGFGDVPALASGGSSEVSLAQELRMPVGFAPRYLIAVVDSSNYVRESQELNNVVVSAVLE
jgi:hypothetical protein